jgi:hypothetical protein
LASTPIRRPLPALFALLALLLLTSLVWWRVLHRGGDSDAAASCPTQAAPAATLPAPALITVEVLNATKRNGIGARARTALVSDGFNIPKPAANDRPKVKVPGIAEIRFGPTGRDGATLLHYYLPGARMVPTKSKTATVVVSLGAKYRTIASRSSVEAALARKRVELNSATPGTPSESGSPSC